MPYDSHALSCRGGKCSFYIKAEIADKEDESFMKTWRWQVLMGGSD